MKQLISEFEEDRVIIDAYLDTLIEPKTKKEIMYHLMQHVFKGRINPRLVSEYLDERGIK